ncbi:hypothetical protein [Deinococcus peraridilitoris]|uniref:hypothetical protein n=1 Tax=Deinococcus peraridilitoris TaxID=432329 RepID=UPI000304888A|nr:hypothetical protein [Deinococcus peraridilitoris]
MSSSWLTRVLGVPRTDRSAGLRAAQALVLIAGALAVWAMSLPGINLENIGEFGLIGALPWTFFVALGVLVIGFCATINERSPSVPLLALYTVGLNVILRGTIPLIYEEPRYSWVYKHFGVTNYIRENAAVNPFVDAYHNWPGFFALGALFTDAAGFSGPIVFAPWAQLFWGVLFIGPLLLIFRSFTSDVRVIWSGVFFFSLANWVGQEYYAPQAFAFFMFLVIMAVILTALKRVRSDARVAHQPSDTLNAPTGPSSAWRTVGVSLLVLVLFGAIVPSHQLTPFMLLTGLVALIVFRQVKIFTLPIWLLGATLLWNFTMATAFMSGHNDWYEGLGKFAQNFNSSLRTTSPGSETPRNTALLINQAFTLSLWGLAFLGCLRRLRWGHRDWSAALLAVAPFPLIVAQSYGGEMLLRVFLFSSPFMAFFVAALIFPDERARSGRTTTLLSVAIGGVFAAGFMFAHFANELYNHLSPQEVRAARYLYGSLPPKSLLVFASYSNFPEKISGNYDQFNSITITGEYRLQGSDKTAGDFDVNDFASFVREQMEAGNNPRAYVVFTSGQRNFVEFQGLLPQGTLDGVEAKVRSSSLFNAVYANGDARVYQLRSVPTSGATR